MFTSQQTRDAAKIERSHSHKYHFTYTLQDPPMFGNAEMNQTGECPSPLSLSLEPTKPDANASESESDLHPVRKTSRPLPPENDNVRGFRELKTTFSLMNRALGSPSLIFSC